VDVIFEGLYRYNGAFWTGSQGFPETSLSFKGDFLIVSAAVAGTGI
jgi:hypothetical protein